MGDKRKVDRKRLKKVKKELKELKAKPRSDVAEKLGGEIKKLETLKASGTILDTPEIKALETEISELKEGRGKTQEMIDIEKRIEELKEGAEKKKSTLKKLRKQEKKLKRKLYRGVKDAPSSSLLQAEAKSKRSSWKPGDQCP